MYRSTLAEMKYLQNEITNLESKVLAIRIAIVEKRENALDAGLEKLFATERNFVLKKDETTVEIEHARLDHQKIEEMMKVFGVAFGKGKQ